jgi:hypothetical protein
MDSYDTSAEYLRTRVQKVADEISQHLQKTPAGEQFFFICDIVNAVENAVGDVVHVAQDGVNAAVNVTHNIVTAVENIGERAIHATENAVNAVTAHTQQIIEVANLAAATFKITQEVVDLVGAAIAQEAGGAAAKGGAKASAAQLIQARRAIILDQRKALISATEAKRTELKSKIDAVAARLSAASRSSSS